MAAQADSGISVETDTTSSVYQELHRRLIAREVPADRPLLETALSSELGVARSSAREALLLLHHDGLLERVSRGFRVRRRSAEEILEIIEIRTLLESEIAARAAMHHRPLDLARLTHLQEVAESRPYEPALDWQWHEAIRDAAHSPNLAELVQSLVFRLAAAESPNYSPVADPAANTADHRRITDAVVARDADAARKAMIAHLERVRDLRLAAFAQLPRQ